MDLALWPENIYQLGEHDLSTNMSFGLGKIPISKGSKGVSLFIVPNISKMKKTVASRK